VSDLPNCGSVRPGGSSGHSPAFELADLIREARSRLPTQHRALLEHIRVQDTVVNDWPREVQAIYRSAGLTPPATRDLRDAVAVWLQQPRVVAFNGQRLGHALADPELGPDTRRVVLENVAWHEYGHALSATLASPEMKRGGVRLLEVLPSGLRRAIDYPGSYRARQVFDEVIANVYALMIRRVVHHNDYGWPDFLDRQVFEAFESVVPWPPDPR